MRIQPRPDEKPALGFSWGDYEDVNVSEEAHGTSRGGAENDADGEGDDDNDGWGVVKSRKPSTSEYTFIILHSRSRFLQNQHDTYLLKLKPVLNHNLLQNNPNANAKTRPNAMLKKPLKHLQKLNG